MTAEVEVLLIGSGAAASLMAAHIAESGRRVLMLEAGPDRGMQDLVSSQLWARRLKWGGSPVIEKGSHPIGHAFNAGWGVGGAAMHHYGVWPRLHPEDFETKKRYGKALDWPLTYGTLRPFYDRVQREVGISGDAEAEVWRPEGEGYPMKPVPLFRQGKILARGFKARGMATSPIPLAVNTEPYDGRPPCIYDGWCDAGCPIGALGTPLAVHLPRAKKAGTALKTSSVVTRILTDDEGTRVVGVEYVTREGDRRRQLADVTIMAAFAIQNPRLLLASATSRHPAGLANSSGMVGKCVMTHPAGLIYGLFEEDTECYMGATGGQLLCQDGYVKDEQRSGAAFGSYQWMIAQAVKPNDLLGIATTRPDLFGAGLDDFMKRATRGFATMTAAVESLPVEANRVVLSDRTDAHGVPLAEVTHSLHPESQALWEHTLQEGKSVFEAAGAKEVWTGPPGAMHIMGGTVMGDDPATSVTNSYGQTHDIPNLFIAGPGLFPTSGGVNPTFTVSALALRAADYIVSEWNGLKSGH